MIKITKILLVVTLLFVMMPKTALAVDYAHCNLGGCTAGECGPIMCGIAQECADKGNCNLRDIEVVIYNVGNFILALLGALVFLMYIIGGVYWLASRGDSKMVTTGKNYLKYSTFGLIIVFVAYAGVKTFESVLRGNITTSAESDCANPENNGNTCGLNSYCYQKRCQSLCKINFSSFNYSCIDIETIGGVQLIDPDCQPDHCPGSLLCCPPQSPTTPDFTPNPVPDLPPVINYGQ